MAISAFGLKVSETETEVRYEVRRDDPNGEPDGILVIGKDDPREHWWVEGPGASRALASKVGGRVFELFAQSGRWPDRAARIS